MICCTENLIVWLLALLSILLCYAHSDRSHSNLYHRQRLRDIKRRKNAPVVHFGIVIGVGNREIDPDYMLLNHQVLKSIVEQIYTDWTIILVGDNLPPNHLDKVRNIIEERKISNRVILRNLDYSQTNNATYERLNLTQVRPWFNSGVCPVNYGLKLANSLSYVTHIKPFSDDDWMRPSHLLMLRRAYAISPKIAVAFTLGTNIGSDEPRVGFEYDNPNQEKFVKYAPMPVHTVGATLSFHKELVRARFRLCYEQRALFEKWGLWPLSIETRRKWGIEEGYDVMANDAFFYMEMAYGYNVTNATSILVTNSSVDYLDTKAKAQKLKELYSLEGTKNVFTQ